MDRERRTEVGDRLGVTYDPRDPSVISSGRGINTALLLFTALLSAAVLVVAPRLAFRVLTAPPARAAPRGVPRYRPPAQRRHNVSAKKAARRRRRR